MNGRERLFAVFKALRQHLDDGTTVGFEPNADFVEAREREAVEEPLGSGRFFIKSDKSDHRDEIDFPILPTRRYPAVIVDLTPPKKEKKPAAPKSPYDYHEPTEPVFDPPPRLLSHECFTIADVIRTAMVENGFSKRRQTLPAGRSYKSRSVDVNTGEFYLIVNGDYAKLVFADDKTKQMFRNRASEIEATIVAAVEKKDKGGRE